MSITPPLLNWLTLWKRTSPRGEPETAQGTPLNTDMGTAMSPRAMIVGVILILTTLACGGADRILPPTITLVRPPTDTPRPTETPSPTHTVRPRPDPVQTIHVVQPGETLSEIARQYGVSIDALTAVNGIADPHLIKIGQELVIPGPAPATR